MKVELVVIGKTKVDYVADGMDDFISRLEHYTKFELTELPNSKHSGSSNNMLQKMDEGKMLINHLAPTDFLILLEEKGQSYTSREFSTYLNNLQLQGRKKVCFAVGGPYGFSEQVRQRSNFKISLSKMTFPHDLIRLIFLEQLYRAHTIIKREPYHHD